MNSLSIHRMAIVFLLAAISLLAIRQCNNKAKEVNEVKEVLLLQHDTIIRYKDVAGREHAKVGVEVAEMELLRAVHRQEVDSLLILIKAKEKQLQSAVFAGTQTTGTGRAKIDTVYIDRTKPLYKLSYADEWLSLEGEIADKALLKYKYKDSLVFATTKTKGYYSINAYSLNPNTVFTGITSFQLPIVKQKRFGFGPFIGFGYDGERWRPGIGVSLHYSLIQF